MYKAMRYACIQVCTVIIKRERTVGIEEAAVTTVAAAATPIRT